ncbi:Aste57867_20641 [Aphanomyces stellatus]|uniref:Aste57867_20641 protein n=1 Tax=Aphanomyces stellatus TaxID=120398 RepID=A0A485LGW1_9STRA|nr:hypothetical protein As57867_020573 [Aphanomyces stellatus]VFT97321.1 Aste57867_20641 [Aphanomyces stellatus]
MKRAISTKVEAEKAAMEHIERFEDKEDRFVRDMTRASARSVREESRLHQSMSNPTSRLADSAYLPCWAFFPVLLETHCTLLQQVRSARYLDVQERAQYIATTLTHAAPYLSAIHESYAVHYQCACQHDASSHTPQAITDALRIPLSIMDETKRCLLGLQACVPHDPDLSRAIDLVGGGTKAALATQRQEIQRRVEVEDSVHDIPLQERTLVLEETLRVSVGRAPPVRATVYLFDGALVSYRDDTKTVLSAVDSSKKCPISIYHSPEMTTCTLLANGTTTSILFHSADACSEWTQQIAEHVVSHLHPVFEFDLQVLLASIESFPKAWLVTDTETANAELSGSDTMWLLSDGGLPRLHQFYVMKDMIIYGEITGPADCQYVGYMLGENISVHDPPRRHPVSSSYSQASYSQAFELEVMQGDAPPMSLLVCPVRESARSAWIETFQRLKTDLVVSSSAESEEVFVVGMMASTTVPRLDDMATRAATTTTQTPPVVDTPSTTRRARTDSDDGKSDASTTCSSPLPRAKRPARVLRIDELTHSSSGTEMESDDDEQGSLDSMLCATHPKKRPLELQIIHSKPREPRDDDVVSMSDSFCSETPPPGPTEPWHPSPAKEAPVVASPPPPPPPRAIPFRLEEEAPTTTDASPDVVPSTQEMEGGAIAFLKDNTPLATHKSEKPKLKRVAEDPPKAKPKPKKTPATKKKAAPKVVPTEDDVVADSDVEDTVPIKPPPAKKPRKEPKQVMPPPSNDVDAIVPSTQEMEGGAIQFLRDVPFVAKPVPQPSSLTPPPAPKTLRIALTGFADPEKLIIKISSIPHAMYEEDVTHATHIVAPSGVLKRTVKILCGISCCLHILDEKWLHVSAKQGAAADETRFCLTDAAKEALWGCSLHQTMYGHTLAQRQALLEGRSFYITRHKSILPPPEDLERIIVCAGGQVVAASEIDAQTIAITSVDAVATAAIKKILKSLRPEQCYTPELLLRCILTQSLDLDQYHVDVPETKKGRKKH